MSNKCRRTLNHVTNAMWGMSWNSHHTIHVSQIWFNMFLRSTLRPCLRRFCKATYFPFLFASCVLHSVTWRPSASYVHKERAHQTLTTNKALTCDTRVYPKVSGLAAFSENCKWYSSLPLRAVFSILLYSQVYCPERLWGPPNLLSNGFLGPFSWG
jgi:hypothetical protein